MAARLCLICRRPESDALHEGFTPAGMARKFLKSEPPDRYVTQHRIEQHAFDPGERRKLIRRMDDRIAAVEKAAGQRPDVDRRGKERRATA